MRSAWRPGFNSIWVRFLVYIDKYHAYCSAERDMLARKSAKGADKMEAVTVFRGINFDEWLRLFMQVRIGVVCKLALMLTCSPMNSTALR